jgi:pimeloyl-ACP methyl ester carboxylesterase
MDIKVKSDVNKMNYRPFIWILPFFSMSFLTYAGEMTEECIDEPVFNGRVCVYQANQYAEDSVVLIHGIGDNASRDWNSQIPALVNDYHILTIDLPGFGRSDHGDKDYSPEQYTALIEFIARRYGIEKFDLLGHSMGAAISLLYASRFPNRVKRLVVVDSAGILHRMAVGKYVIAGKVNGGEASKTNNLESYIVKVIEKVDWIFSIFRDDVAENSEHARAGIELVDYDFGGAIDLLDKPTLIVWGEDDSVAPLRTAKVLHHRIQQSQLRIIKEAGHLPMKDKSEEFNAIMLDFLRDVEVRAPIRGITDLDVAQNSMCTGKRGISFSGHHSRLEIINCGDVEIDNASIGELYVYESRVVVDNSKIGGGVDVALESIGSDIKITASSIRGSTAIKAARSRFDMAAVDLYFKDAAIETVSKSRLICSVCKSHGVAGERSIHDYITLSPGTILWQ